MIGPRPIETVGNCQKSGISHGCGYDEMPSPPTSWRKLFKLLFGQAAEQERTRVDARRRMALHEHEVAAMFRRRRVPEVVEADVIERGGGSERGDVAADVRVLARAQHHRDGVPARVRADAMFEVLIAGNVGLVGDGNRVDVGSIRGERQMLAVHAGKLDLLLDQVMRAIRTYRRYHAVERFEPLGGFLGIVVFGDWRHISELRRVQRTCSSPDLRNAL